jgi:UDP-2-acetamido-3-amino-2,3-dideoxy-glucuronate N-acetyltransferase
MTEQPFIHSNSDVQSQKIGHGTKIWQYCVVLPGATIGSEVNICSHCLVENDVTVGNRVTIKSGVQIWDGITIEDDVFIGPNCAFTNDKYPRSKQHLAAYPKTTICKGASIGANATILPGVTIGAYALIGAGTVVAKDIPAGAIVAGPSGVITGYVDKGKQRVEAQEASKLIGSSSVASPMRRIEMGIDHCALFELPFAEDSRGSLSFAELDKDLPFAVKRCFWVFDVPSNKVRGEHAHRLCHQFLICVSGQVSVMMDNGEKRAEVLLDRPNQGLFLPAGVWGVQYKYSQDAVLIVLASHEYDKHDYIRNYDEFLEYRRNMEN